MVVMMLIIVVVGCGGWCGWSVSWSDCDDRVWYWWAVNKGVCGDDGYDCASRVQSRV